MLRRALKNFGEFVFFQIARGSRVLAGFAHKGLYLVQWGIKPLPNWFDHNIDAYWQWPAKCDSSWLERGVLNSLCLAGGTALELTCGDGFYTSRFYARKLKHVIACDHDKKAIASARQCSRASNVDYVVADILTEMPVGKFEHVIWDFGFPWCKHFTVLEIDSVVSQCKARLKTGGVFSGYLALSTHADIVEQSKGEEEIDFKSIGTLKTFLLRYFAHVSVIETLSPGRHNAYFYASDGIVPFGEGWTHTV